MRLLLIVGAIVSLNSVPKSVANGGDESDLSPRFAEDVVHASFAADALCLGPHWIYDTGEIARLYPDGLSGLDAPRSDYHPGKVAGDFTHYGDQALVLLESIVARGGFSTDEWLEDWAAYWMSDPESYLDGATVDALANFRNGIREPSGSHDLAGVSRMGPLLAYLADAPLDEIVLAAREQVGVTHGDPHVADAAEFFARAIFAVRKGADYAVAFEKAAGEGSYSYSIEEELEAVRAKLDGGVGEVAQTFGQSCNVVKAFPLTLWFALRFEGSPEQMLEENALAGGDSSARGMLLGMLIAASGRYGELPTEWTQGINALGRIDAALEKLNAL